MGVLVAAALPGLCGAQKYPGTPVATRNRACSAISVPWSRVRGRRSGAGSAVMAPAGAWATVPAVWSWGRGTRTMNRLVRSATGRHGAEALADHQVALPVPGHRPVTGLRWPPGDAGGAADLALAVAHGPPAAAAAGPAGPQVPGRPS